MPTTRRDWIADAALATLADQGGRGLTHRAVDGAAGVAVGTTSYYFRTRKALLLAAVRRLAEVDTAAIQSLPDDSPETLLEALAGVVEEVARGTETREIARLELALEGRRDDEMRGVLTELGETVHQAVADKLSAAGVSDPGSRTTMLLVLIDGLVVDRLSGSAARVPTLDQVRAMLATVLGRS